MHAPVADIRPRRLFVASCISLIATSVSFAVIGAIMLTLKREFTLTNLEVGWIAGAGLWGFAVSQLLFSPFCDTLGMRRLLRLAFLCHLGGALFLMASTGFWMLLFGALTLALGNGLVEACRAHIPRFRGDPRRHESDCGARTGLGADERSLRGTSRSRPEGAVERRMALRRFAANP